MDKGEQIELRRREAAGAIAEHIAGPLHPNSAGFSFLPWFPPLSISQWGAEKRMDDSPRPPQPPCPSFQAAPPPRRRLRQQLKCRIINPPRLCASHFPALQQIPTAIIHPSGKKMGKTHRVHPTSPASRAPLTFGLLGGCLCRRLGRGLALVQCSSFSPAVGRSIRNPVAVAGCVAGSEPLAGSASFVEAGRAGGAAGLSDGGAR